MSTTTHGTVELTEAELDAIEFYLRTDLALEAQAFASDEFGYEADDHLAEILTLAVLLTTMMKDNRWPLADDRAARVLAEGIEAQEAELRRTYIHPHDRKIDVDRLAALTALSSRVAREVQ